MCEILTTIGCSVREEFDALKETSDMTLWYKLRTMAPSNATKSRVLKYRNAATSEDVERRAGVPKTVKAERSESVRG